MSSYCRCGHEFVFDEVALVKLIPSDKDLTLAYICGTCNKVSHALPYGDSELYGPSSARAPLGWRGQKDGTYRQMWSTDTPHERIETMGYAPYPSTRVNGMDQGRNHLLAIWRRLDEYIDFIRDETQLDDLARAKREGLKERASELGEVLAQLMSPFYADSASVLRESMARWQARQTGVTHDSPGLGEHYWDPVALAEAERAKNPVRTNATRAAAPRASVPRKTGNLIPDSAVNTAKQGIEMGMFTVKQMADTYKMTEAELKKQLGLA